MWRYTNDLLLLGRKVHISSAFACVSISSLPLPPSGVCVCVCVCLFVCLIYTDVAIYVYLCVFMHSKKLFWRMSDVTPQRHLVCMYVCSRMDKN